MNTTTLKNLVLSATFAAVLVGHAVAAPTAPALKTQTTAAAQASSTSGAFKGIEVNGGKVILSHVGAKHILKLSNEFVVPKSPAPSWQIVDKEGNVYLLKQLRIAGGKLNKQITLPSYIKSIAKVQIWCSFAEVNLGEASFDTTIELN